MASTPLFRAEHVGSLLRPQRLKDAARGRSESSEAERRYRETLDQEVARAIRMQEDLGLRVITDGEFGRSSWFGFFFERLEGFRLAESNFRFRDPAGGEYTWQTCFTAEQMRRPRPIAGEEFDRVRRNCRGTPKACLPSPSALHFFRGDDCRDPAVYPEIDAWWEDVVDIYRAEVRDLAARGCQYLQLDEVPLAMLCDDGIRDGLRTTGIDPDVLRNHYIDVTNRVLEVAPPSMTLGMHLCRGNFRSRWMAAGGYEPIAEALFGNLNVHSFFLEYDTERAGDFEPLRFVPTGKGVVLGLVSTKTPVLEDPDALLRRIEAASARVPLERLALSPQCGFASVAGGNTIGEPEQRAKLQLVVKTAARVWG